MRHFRTVCQLFKNLSGIGNLSSRCLHHQARSKNQPISNIDKYRKLIKPFLFTITVCGTSFTIATIVQYENNLNNNKRRHKRIVLPWNFTNHHSPWSNKMQKEWDSKKTSLKIFCGLAILNGLVFFCWRVPRLNNFMSRYFISRIEKDSIRCLPMILSNFSHYSLTHFGMNMVVLYSFCDLGVNLFGKEHFLALYFSSGIVSSFVSCFHKVIFNMMTPSLGASGAILGILGATCLERPDIKLMIIFLPFITFSSYTALKSILLIDALGIFFRWGLLDHAAHMGGTLFGMYYSNTLIHVISKKRMTILKNWNNFKNKF